MSWFTDLIRKRKDRRHVKKWSGITDKIYKKKFVKRKKSTLIMGDVCGSDYRFKETKI